VHWLQDFDLGLLRFINQTLSNAFFDALMPFASGNAYFFPVVIAAGLLMLWKGGMRGRLCILMLALIVGPGDGMVINTIKHAVARPRPYVIHSDVLLPASKAPRQLKSVEDRQVENDNAVPPARRKGYNGMPSAHAANWFSTTMIFLVYFRRSLWLVLPLACVVSFSRVYNGVHYPSDVLAGAILGAGYAVAGMWLINGLWQVIGKEWFPLWWARVPSLIIPDSGIQKAQGVAAQPGSEKGDVREADLKSQISNLKSAGGTPVPDIDTHWLRFGYVLIAILLFVRLGYIASGEIELSGDEAYQWIWSKHLALSYFSKPLMIALTQWLGTNLWGDTEFGVRFFSPVLAALTSLLLLRFLTRFVSGRAGVMLLLVSATTPLLSVGSTLMTIDPLSVFFWILAMLAGWRAVQPDSKASDWLWTGWWMGLGFLSKYTGLFQLLCWGVFFLLHKPARQHLRRPGPYLALLVNALCTLPVLIWNSQHNWITVSHVADNADVGRGWNPRVLDFLGVELALLNPVYFIGAIWAAIAFWRSLRRNPVAVYLFSMGTPLFACYFLWSFHSRILPNWIAPAILPMFCLMILYWRERWPGVRHWARPIVTFGLVLGALVVVVLHDTDLIGKIAGRPLPSKIDPLTRVRTYRESARVIGELRENFLAEGKPVFIIGGHYQTAGLLSFYLPEARTNVTGTALVYARPSSRPRNQFHFLPGYKEQRQGQNALYVRELNAPKLTNGWVFKWLNGETNLLRHPHISEEPHAQIVADFESVRDLGQFHVYHRDRIFHTYQVFECRNLH
jgi:membrane-associated phospholipid phosphatase